MLKLFKTSLLIAVATLLLANKSFAQGGPQGCSCDVWNGYRVSLYYLTNGTPHSITPDPGGNILAEHRGDTTHEAFLTNVNLMFEDRTQSNFGVPFNTLGTTIVLGGGRNPMSGNIAIVEEINQPFNSSKILSLACGAMTPTGMGMPPAPVQGAVINHEIWVYWDMANAVNGWLESDFYIQLDQITGGGTMTNPGCLNPTGVYSTNYVGEPRIQDINTGAIWTELSGSSGHPATQHVGYYFPFRGTGVWPSASGWYHVADLVTHADFN